MSLINDALKKAQKMRTPGHATYAPRSTDGNAGPVAKRAQPMSAKLLAGIVAGTAVLVAGSVLVTVFLLRKPEAAPAPKPVTAPASVSESSPPTPAASPSKSSAPASAPTPPTVAPAPIVVVPPPPAPSGTATIAPKAESQSAAALPVVSAPPPTSAPAPQIEIASATPANSGPTPAAVSAPIRPVATPPAAPRPDPRAQAFVDTMRITGIRASGSDSKVLMNDRVFRVNDIVERSLGLRLTEVATDRLTFTDENGVVYTRNF